MSNQGILISVVIPLFNGSNNIKKCINQLDAQDCDFPFEVIVVDDSSTDDSADIVEKQMKNLTRSGFFHLIRSPRNGRAGSARNIGIRAAIGKYLLFIDQDDYPDTTMLRVLWDNSRSGSIDLISCAVMDRYGGPYYRPELKGDHPISKEERKKIIQSYGYVFASLIRRSLLIDNGIFFAENVMFEDCLYNCGVMSCVNTVQTIKDVLYFRINEQGSQTGCLSVRKINDRIDATLIYLDAYENHQMISKYMDQIRLVAFYYIYLSNMLWIVTMPGLFQKELIKRVLFEGKRLRVKWKDVQAGEHTLSGLMMPLMHLLYVCPFMVYPFRVCGSAAYKILKMWKNRK